MYWISRNGITILTASVAFVWLLFLVIVLWPSVVRRLARGLKLTKLARRLRTQYYVRDLLLWARHPADAMLNVTKAYEWRIAQWSGFANAVLTATLAFASAVLLEYFKDTIYTNTNTKLLLALLGILASVLVYLMAQRRITLLREQCLRVFSLLSFVHRIR